MAKLIEGKIFSKLPREKQTYFFEKDKELEAALLKAINAPKLDVAFMTDDEVREELEHMKGYDEPRAHVNADKVIADFLLNVLHLRNSARILRSIPVWYE